MRVGEEGRKGCVDANEILGGGRRRYRRPWPAGVGEALMMFGDGLGSRRERRKKLSPGFLFYESCLVVGSEWFH